MNHGTQYSYSVKKCRCDKCLEAWAFKLEKQRIQRRETKNAATKRYEKTPKGFLMRVYRNMQSRVQGVQKDGTWVGQSILPKDKFYDWALGSTDFWRLFRTYEQSNYIMKLAPSVNRINSSKGYELNNMEWVTHSINSALSSTIKNKDLNRTMQRIYDQIK